jgi:DNA-binding SARP family transcriptional activator
MTHGWTPAGIAALTTAQALRSPLDIFVSTVETATDEAIAGHPRALLHLARALEPGQRLSRRGGALDRLAAMLDPEDPIQLEVSAEHAIDLARTGDLDAPEQIARDILTRATADDRIARARASEALGRVLAWRGDEASARSAARVLSEAAEQYAALDCVEWQAFAIFWRGNSVYYQRGDLEHGEAEMREALALLPPHSPRRGVVLTFLAEIRTMQGDWSEADVALDEALALADEYDDAAARAYSLWQRARIASLTGDADATERYFRETEQHRADWFDITSGSTYLADAAETLDRVGRHEAADGYLQRALELDPTDEFVMQAQAALLARRGDPVAALAALRALTQAPWLEGRLAWRRTLLTAYACLRAGNADAAMLAARALEQAGGLGDPHLAAVGEPELTRILAPLAASAGSLAAQRLLAPHGEPIVRVMGEVSIRRNGDLVPLPTGVPGALVRLLSVRPAGLDVEEVIEILWPELDAPNGRRRIRGALARLRARSGDIVVRDESRLRLTSGWVDAQAFREAADRALAARGRDRAALAVAALALWGGEVLPGDPYESWAAGPREQLRRRRVDLLDLVAADAAERESFEEARYALEQAIEVDPYDDTRYVQVARHLLRLGRRVPAGRTLQRACTVLAELGLEPTPAVRRAMSDVAAYPDR